MRIYLGSLCFYFWVTAWLLLLSPQAIAAEIRVLGSSIQNGCMLSIEGPIQEGDCKKFIEIISDLNNKGKGIFVVHLASAGGDAIEAMKIGRAIRKRFIKTMAPMSVPHRDGGTMNACFGKVFGGNKNFDKEDPDCTCASACFLIWSGGVIREGNVLGVHRPRFSSKYFQGLNADQAQDKYRAMSKNVKDYLVEMDVPTRIADTVFSVDSDKLMLLNQESIGSMQSVPFFYEWIRTKCEALTGDELVEQRKLVAKSALSKADQFYLDHLNDKYWKYDSCISAKIIESQLQR